MKELRLGLEPFGTGQGSLGDLYREKLPREAILGASSAMVRSRRASLGIFTTLLRRRGASGWTLRRPRSRSAVPAMASR